MNTYTTELLARDRIASLESDARGTAMVTASRDRRPADEDRLGRLVLRLARMGRSLRRSVPVSPVPVSPVPPSTPAGGGIRLGQ